MKKYMQMRAEPNWQNPDLAYCLFILYEYSHEKHIKTVHHFQKAFFLVLKQNQYAPICIRYHLRIFQQLPHQMLA